MSAALRLKILRSHYQLSMRALADTIGVSQAQVSMWESGKNAIPRPTALAFQAALGIRWEWLLNGEGEMLLDDMGKLSPQEVRLVELFRQGDMQARDEILEQAEFQIGRAIRRIDKEKTT